MDYSKTPAVDIKILKNVNAVGGWSDSTSGNRAKTGGIAWLEDKDDILRIDGNMFVKLSQRMIDLPPSQLALLTISFHSPYIFLPTFVPSQIFAVRTLQCAKGSYSIRQLSGFCTQTVWRGSSATRIPVF